jgi:hypothetical protein
MFYLLFFLISNLIVGVLSDEAIGVNVSYEWPTEYYYYEFPYRYPNGSTGLPTALSCEGVSDIVQGDTCVARI